MTNLRNIGGGKCTQAKYQFCFFFGESSEARDSSGKVSDVWLAKRLCQRMASLTGKECGFHMYEYTSINSQCASSAGSKLYFSTIDD